MWLQNDIQVLWEKYTLGGTHWMQVNFNDKSWHIFVFNFFGLMIWNIAVRMLFSYPVAYQIIRRRSKTTPAGKNEIHLAVTQDQKASRRTLDTVYKISCARQVMPSTLRSTKFIKIRVKMRNKNPAKTTITTINSHQVHNRKNSIN